MNPKTKKKIEAMADKYWAVEDHDSTQIAFEDGAELFAEWCERFETLCQYLQTRSVEKMEVEDHCRNILREYRSWLESE